MLAECLPLARDVVRDRTLASGRAVHTRLAQGQRPAASVQFPVAVALLPPARPRPMHRVAAALLPVVVVVALLMPRAAAVAAGTTKAAHLHRDYWSFAAEQWPRIESFLVKLLACGHLLAPVGGGEFF